MPKKPGKFALPFAETGVTRVGGLSLFHSSHKSPAFRHFLQLAARCTLPAIGVPKPEIHD
jgi:hypothetical protein